MNRKSPHNHPHRFWVTQPVTTWLEAVRKGEMTLADATAHIRSEASGLLSRGKEITEGTVRYYVGGRKAKAAAKYH